MPDSPDDKIPPQKNRQEHGEPSLTVGEEVNYDDVNLAKGSRERNISEAYVAFSLAVAKSFAYFIDFLLFALAVTITIYIFHIMFDFERTQEALSFVWNVLSSGAPLALTVLLWSQPRR